MELVEATETTLALEYIGGSDGADGAGGEGGGGSDGGGGDGGGEGGEGGRGGGKAFPRRAEPRSEAQLEPQP